MCDIVTGNDGDLEFISGSDDVFDEDEDLQEDDDPIGREQSDDQPGPSGLNLSLPRSPVTLNFVAPVRSPPVRGIGRGSARGQGTHWLPSSLRSSVTLAAAERRGTGRGRDRGRGTRDQSQQQARRSQPGGEESEEWSSETSPVDVGPTITVGGDPVDTSFVTVHASLD